MLSQYVALFFFMHFLFSVSIQIVHVIFSSSLLKFLMLSLVSQKMMVQLLPSLHYFLSGLLPPLFISPLSTYICRLSRASLKLPTIAAFMYFGLLIYLAFCFLELVFVPLLICCIYHYYMFFHFTTFFSIHLQCFCFKEEVP